MRALMGLIKDRHGTYCAQQKVPARLQAAVAQVLGNGKTRQVYLKKSLGTKDLKTANVRAKLVLAGFDRVIRDAKAIAAQAQAATAAGSRPYTPPSAIRSSLNAAEIRRMSEALYGKLLADDEAFRFGGRAFVAEGVEWIRRNEDPDYELPYPLESVREYGWSPEQLAQQKENMVHELATMQEALALGDITAVVDDVSLLLAAFDINLDPKSASYRELGMQALRAYVRALQAIDKRNAGEPIETPKFTSGVRSAGSVASRVRDAGATEVSGGSLRDAFTGWNKERTRPAHTVQENRRAMEMFIQLHGDLPVAAIKKSHARLFREALQDVPQRRTGDLLGASLPDLAAWGRKHPDVPKVSPGTINKQLGAVQALAAWGYANGVIPDDVSWSDPFARMRVPVEQSDRTSFTSHDLKLLLAAPVFTKHEYPEGGRGVTSFWLPLLALFTGARQSELAGLTVADVQEEPETATPLFYITSQASRGKRLKTKASQRVIPVHAELVKLGLLKFVEDVRRRAGEKAFLFPLIAPTQGRAGVAAWAKWFGRYLRAQGVTDAAKVFHSFRHAFKDALRQGKVNQELHDALTGHAQASTVSGGYGAKEMLARFGVEVLSDAVAKVSYRGLDLSRVQPFSGSVVVVGERTRIQARQRRWK
jgi:integrase